MKAKFIMDMLRLFARIFSIFIFLPQAGFAQQIQMNTPFLLNRNYVNPSYNGNLDLHQFDFFIGSKSKWDGIPGSPTVNAAHAMAKFTEKHSGGIQLIEHAFATFNYKSFALPYSFTAKLNERHTFRLGLSTRFVQSNIDFSNAITEMTIEPAKENYDRITVFLDANAGISYHYEKRLAVGLSISNFLVNGSVNESELLNYASYSLLQTTYDVHYVLHRSQNMSLMIDALATTNGAMTATYQLFMTAERQFTGAIGLAGFGYKSTGELVSIARLKMPKFYYLYTFEIPVRGSSLTSFTGTYIGLGYSLGKVK